MIFMQKTEFVIAFYFSETDRTSDESRMSVLNVFQKRVCIFCKATQEVIRYFTKSEIDVFKLFY